MLRLFFWRRSVDRCCVCVWDAGWMGWVDDLESLGRARANAVVVCDTWRSSCRSGQPKCRVASVILILAGVFCYFVQ